ncbi:MAG: hypothetical protein VKM34_07785 [Cyanobacteriota bacterium]|nr:hypothetical protein [Cyanobacteriota bacterium]
MELFSELLSEQQQGVCGGGAAGAGKPGPQSGVIYDSKAGGLAWTGKDPGAIATEQSNQKASLVVNVVTINNGSGAGGLSNAFGS